MLIPKRRFKVAAPERSDDLSDWVKAPINLVTKRMNNRPKECATHNSCGVRSVPRYRKYRGTNGAESFLEQEVEET